MRSAIGGLALLWACASGCSVYYSNAPEICPRLDEAACNAKNECAYVAKYTCSADVARAPAVCLEACRAFGQSCETEHTFCSPIMPPDGKRSHNNRDIVSCSTRDARFPCELQLAPGGAKICEYAESPQGKGPCAGCTLQKQGECRTRDKCVGPICGRGNLG